MAKVDMLQKIKSVLINAQTVMNSLRFQFKSGTNRIVSSTKRVTFTSRKASCLKTPEVSFTAGYLNYY